MLNDTQRNFIDQAVSQWQSYFDKSTEMFRKVGQSNTQTLEEIIEYQNANYKATGQWQGDILSRNLSYTLSYPHLKFQ